MMLTIQAPRKECTSKFQIQGSIPEKLVVEINEIFIASLFSAGKPVQHAHTNRKNSTTAISARTPNMHVEGTQTSLLDPSYCTCGLHFKPSSCSYLTFLYTLFPLIHVYSSLS